MLQDFLTPKPVFQLEGDDFYEFTDRYYISETNKVYDAFKEKMVPVTASHRTSKTGKHSYMVFHFEKEDGTFTRMRMHRALATVFIKNPEGKKFVDHIDHNTLNNSVFNLRWVTTAENAQNRKPRPGKYFGVNKYKNRFRATIKWNGEMLSLGYYDKAEDAAIAYNKRAEELGYLTRNEIPEIY